MSFMLDMAPTNGLYKHFVYILHDYRVDMYHSSTGVGAIRINFVPTIDSPECCLMYVYQMGNRRKGRNGHRRTGKISY